MSPRQSVVVAGGIGSGKSTVTAALSRLGWTVIDADRIGHEVLMDPDVVGAIAALWPEAVAGGEVNRSVLGSVVFADHEQLRALEEITHPLIVGSINHRIDGQSGPIAVEVSVLKVARPDWGPVILVHAPASIRLERLVERGLSKTDATARMAAQLSDAELLVRADAVVDNQGTTAELDKTVELLDHWVRS
jgi:dephospho-CoA kinase